MRNTVYKWGITHSWDSQQRLLAEVKLEFCLKGCQIKGTAQAKIKDYSNHPSLFLDHFMENMFKTTLDILYNK